MLTSLLTVAFYLEFIPNDFWSRAHQRPSHQCPNTNCNWPLRFELNFVDHFTLLLSQNHAPLITVEQIGVFFICAMFSEHEFQLVHTIRCCYRCDDADAAVIGNLWFAAVCMWVLYVGTKQTAGSLTEKPWATNVSACDSNMENSISLNCWILFALIYNWIMLLIKYFDKIWNSKQY